MTCVPIKNSFEQESLYVPAGTDPADIRSPYRELITEEYLAFLDNSLERVEQLKDMAELPVLKRWFESVCQLNQFGLIVHYADCSDFASDGRTHIQSDLTITTSYTSSHSINFRLPMDWDTSHLPSGLAEFYQVMDGLIEEADVFCTAGFNRMPAHPDQDIVPDARRMNFSMFVPYTEEDEELWRQGAWSFYHCSTGDLLLAIDDQAYSWLHENGTSQHQGSTASMVEAYFESVLDGGPWSPFHY